jgi:hypothetical protein
LVHITTNGTLTDRIAQFGKESKGSKLFIAISLNSLQEAHELRKLVDHCKLCWIACESIPNGIYTWDVLAFHLRKIFKKNLLI